MSAIRGERVIGQIGRTDDGYVYSVKPTDDMLGYTWVLACADAEGNPAKVIASGKRSTYPGAMTCIASGLTLLRTAFLRKPTT